jgi:predicted RNase H-like HicB family nuclease
MISVYPACFFKEETGYSVIFPDLNWLATCGTTESDAMAMAVDCLAGYLYSQSIAGEQVSGPSAMNEISLDEVATELDLDYETGFLSMVAVDVDEYAREHFEKTVRKTLSIPAWLNKAAMEKHINFSQTLKEALLAKIKSC